METAAETSLGQTIKRARERRLWTQQQLADAVSVSRNTIINWEADAHVPKNRIGALEAVLGIDLTSAA